MNAPLYDAHLHLQLPPLHEQAEEILEELRKRNVRKIVVNGTCEDDWQAVASLAEKDDMVIPAFGLHPWHAHTTTAEWKNTLSSYLDRYPFCMGEIGLDRWMENPDLPRQQDAFVFQLREAKRRRLPAAIHCLKAWGQLLEILKQEAPFPRPFLIHSYGGSAEMIGPFASLGAYFSISGYFAYPRKEKQREVFRQMPLDRLLLETDAPDMLPPPEMRVMAHGSEWNHPANISTVYAFAANLFGTPLENLASQVETNFQRFYGCI